jgi:hypothetical protein
MKVEKKILDCILFNIHRRFLQLHPQRFVFLSANVLKNPPRQYRPIRHFVRITSINFAQIIQTEFAKRDMHR